MTLEGMFEAPLQHSLPVLPNVRLDELGPVLGVGRPLPLSFGDKGGPSRRGLPFFVQGEVFDVYPVGPAEKSPAGTVGVLELRWETRKVSRKCMPLR